MEIRGTLFFRGRNFYFAKERIPASSIKEQNQLTSIAALLVETKIIYERKVIFSLALSMKGKLYLVLHYL